ncbi:MAG TPA: hypothetical protein VD815_08730 [Candidatus Saccharimonadales bacterium]|nr:hypothetical protein [Candidatus Saccharimonadales bacterium]
MVGNTVANDPESYAGVESDTRRMDNVDMQDGEKEVEGIDFDGSGRVNRF